MSKQKRREKQDAEKRKLTEDVLSGRAKIAFYKIDNKYAQSNRKGGATPTDEEADEMTQRYARLLRVLLPGILVILSQIYDPRDQNRIDYVESQLMLFGILMFLSHCSSRRAANRELANKNLLDLVKEFVPGAKDMPHADTLARLLCVIDVEQIDRYYEEMLVEFLHSKQFQERNPGRFLTAIDGTQKFSRKYLWDERLLRQNAGDEEKQRYYVYVVESVLILENGMVLPLLTEILENLVEDNSLPCEIIIEKEKKEASEQEKKQECETKAFHRMAERLVKLLGKGVVTVVLDGIYASGPVISRCQNYGWEYMIVLKRGSLKTVWEDFDGLQRIEPENTHYAQWGNRQQEYHWSNDLEYIYGDNHKVLKLNLVTCTETWIEEHPRSGKKTEKKVTQYAWLSSQRVTSNNVFHLCTKIARPRWKIENKILVEKHQGYQYSNCYSYNWNAMKGFHYLMKFGVFLNAYITHCVTVVEYVRAEGIRGFVKKIWEIIRQGKWPACDKTEDRIEPINLEARPGRKRIHWPPLIKSA